MSRDIELLVIGSGPAGQKAAIAAAKLGRKAAIVERARDVGGVCVHTGTIPSKTLREAIIYLTGINQRSLYGQSYRLKEEVTIDDLMARAQQVVGAEVDVVRDQLRRNHVRLLRGTARFIDSYTVAVLGRDSEEGEETQVQADNIVIAVGTEPLHPASVAFDGRTVLDSDSILEISRIPGSLVVVGAGVIGIEYASMFAALGTKVTVVERKRRLLDFCDSQIVEALQYHLRDLGVSFRFGEDVTAVESLEGGAVTHLKSGKRVASDAVMYSAGRVGATARLDLEAAGLSAGDRGGIEVDDRFCTSVDHIYAAGDVIGFPNLAATSAEQGRLAAIHALGAQARDMSELLPVGIYTIPEISFVGRNEEELTDAGVPYEVGVSRYRELARGQILGDAYGILKLLASPEDGRLLGVHVFGTGATELVHVGQVLMAAGGRIEDLVAAVFNYPTLAESYKVAALDAMNKIEEMSRLVG